jgi:hypothetical protein
MENWKSENEEEEFKRLYYLAMGYEILSDYPKALEFCENSLNLGIDHN